MKNFKNIIILCMPIFLFSSCSSGANTETNGVANSNSEISEKPAKDEVLEFVIQYNLNNENATIDALTQIVKYGDNFELKIPVFDQNEYNFLGWFDENNIQVFDGMYNYMSDLFLNAKWETIWSPFY